MNRDSKSASAALRLASRMCALITAAPTIVQPSRGQEAIAHVHYRQHIVTATADVTQLIAC